MINRNIDKLIKKLTRKDKLVILEMINISHEKRVAISIETAVRDLIIMNDYEKLKKKGMTSLDAFYELSQRTYNGQRFSESTINYIVYRKYTPEEINKNKNNICVFRRR